MYDNGQEQTTIDYVSGYQYKNGSLDFFAMEAGRVKKTSSGGLRYEYNLTDHLGNTRVSFSDTLGNGTAVTLQEDHYYAFGLRIEGLSSTTKDNKFTYNGKELEDEHGLGWYHYGARYYDPQVGRWHGIDPQDEYHSPFTFVRNNPIRLNDPDGAGGNDEVKGKSQPTQQGGNLEVLDIIWNVLKFPTFSPGIPPSLDKLAMPNTAELTSKLAETWNSTPARALIPDAVSIGVNYSFVAGVGHSESFEINWVLRGPESSYLPSITTSPTVAGGFDISIGVGISGTNFLGNVNTITRQGILETSLNNAQVSGFGSGNIGPFNFSGGFGPADNSYGTIQRGIGFGIPLVPIGGKTGGLKNSLILWDSASDEPR